MKMIAMRQSTLAAGAFDAHAKTTRKAAFVARMDKLMPWAALLALIKPHYPKAGNGRPPAFNVLNAAHVLHCQLVQPGR
jgi:hypothetical protein